MAEELTDEQKAELIDGGQAWPRDDAIRIVGKVSSVAWWDMFSPLDTGIMGDLAAGLDDLEPGELSKRLQSEIPQPIWDRHRLKYADPSRHGLSLEPDAAFVGVFKGADGDVGMLIGYRAA